MPANGGAFGQQAADIIDWTIRCDWLQVASSCVILYTHNIMLMRLLDLYACLAGLIVSPMVDVTGLSCNSL